MKAAAEKADADWRHRYRIGGFKVEEPEPEPRTVEEFNAQARAMMDRLRSRPPEAFREDD